MRKRLLKIALLSAVALGSFHHDVSAQTLQDGATVAGHFLGANPPASPPPTVGGASCGTPVLTAGSTDFAGQFQAKGTSTCAVTFGKAFANLPMCVVVDSTTASTYTYTKTAITMGTTVSNDLISWVCVGQVGN